MKANKMYFLRTALHNLSKKIISHSRSYSNYQNPFTRTWNLVSKEIKSGLTKKVIVNPEHADVVVIGGSFIASSVAYWLKVRAGDGLSVVVLGKDPSIANSINTYSHGVLSQHFSLPENIYLSQYSAEFLRNIRDHLKSDIDIQFCPHGTLLLASEKYAEILEKHVVMQKEHGVKNKLLTVEEIQRRYPWVNISDIKLGCISVENEGTFNSEALLRGLIKNSQEMGAIYLDAEVTEFQMDSQRDVLMEGVTPGSFKKINKLVYKTKDNEEFNLKFAACVIAAGSDSSHVAKLAKIGVDSGLLSIPLPVEKRNYNVYSIKNSENSMPVGLNTPYIMDTSGLWLRKDGLQNNLICGQIPSLKKEDSIFDEEIFKPSLYNRYPKCQNLEVKQIATEYYDCNTYDDNGILGPHPYHTNLFIAAGFGRQGIHHSPGIGKAVAELIIDCQYTTIDLIRFGFDRLLIDEPLIEMNVY